ncbi:MAG: hypothetical protein Q8M95_13305 [Candidatus Methanoperedens sp.]|nr:hypothetical protein [Candidatus Methanoperedens sp.]
MRLSNKHRRALEVVLHHLERAEKFLKREDVAGIAVKTEYPNGASYSIVNKECSGVRSVNVVNKNVGSDITGLYAARQLLSDLLNKTDF